MKAYLFKPEFIFVVVVFILILFVSTYGSSVNVVPYEYDHNLRLYDNSELNKYPYEGFIGLLDDINPEAIDPKVEQNPMLDIPRSECLQGYPLNQPQTPYDPISTLSSNHECIGKASNLSNSTGGICFDRKTLNLINSRGGNQTTPGSI